MALSFNEFCFVLSLQAGVVATSSVGLTVIVITFLFNLYAPNEMESYHQISQYIFLYSYLVVMMAGFGFGFVSAFWQTAKKLKIGAILVFFGTGLYVLFSILSFIRSDGVMLYICPGMRCPDHHWLQDARWRGTYKEQMEELADISGLLLNDIQSFDPGIRDAYINHTKLYDDVSTPSNSVEYLLTGSEIPKRNNESLDLISFDGEDYDLGMNDPLAYKGNATTTQKPDKKKPRRIVGDDVLALLLLSFVYTLALIGFFFYSGFIFIAFAKYIDERKI